MYGSQKDAGEFFSIKRCRARATFGILFSIGSFSINVLIVESLAVSVDMKQRRGILITRSPRFISSVTHNPNPQIVP